MESKMKLALMATAALVPLIVLTLGAVVVAVASMLLPASRQEHARLITSELTRMVRAVVRNSKGP
jgi:hypothetical protein